ncbi:hypothetical protein [Symbiopectobacterium purcellii]|uniref:hypothetical protein n=1 Tax=Symbiopectobacterium purcellii TaxID=2871826 RepID=UPI003F82E909
MQGKHLTQKERFYIEKRRGEGVNQAIANRLKNDYILCPDMRQRSIAGCYQNNVAWLYHRQRACSASLDHQQGTQTQYRPYFQWCLLL